MANADIFKRSYTLSLDLGEGGEKKLFSSLDIKYQTKKTMFPSIPHECRIDILGLNIDTINSLTSMSALRVDEALAAKKKIRLSAGYNGKEDQIFDGYIMTAYVDPPPNMWLHITAHNFYRPATEVYDISCDKDMTFAEVFDFCANKIGIVPKNTMIDAEGMKNKSGGFHVKGTMIEVQNELGKLRPDWTVFFDDGALCAVKSYEDASSAAADNIVNLRSGLLNVTGINFFGATVQTWTRDCIPLSQWFTLESTLIPSASGKYRVFQKEYKGHFRGKEWYTIYHGFRGKYMGAT